MLSVPPSCGSMRKSLSKRPKLPKLGLLGKFALLSFAPVLVLGLVLAEFLRSQIHDHAVSEARRAAILVAELGLQPQLSESDLTGGLTLGKISLLDRSLRSGIEASDVKGLKVWNRRGTIVYSHDHRVIGTTFPASEELRQALGGTVATEISFLADPRDPADPAAAGAGKLLSVYVPLQFGHAGRPSGAFEIYLPYAPIVATIARDTRTLYILLFAGLGVLYLTIFRLVAGAARRLRRQAEENKFQALHDPLTALPNRTVFRDRIQQAIRAAQREGESVAVILMDLDRFKEVNDTLGHHSGDLLLQELGSRLHAALRESDTIARLGGDEFGVLLPRVAGVPAVVDVAERIAQALREPFLLEDLPLVVEASVGAAVFPTDGADADTLIQRADVAMYVAKSANSDFELYDPRQDEYDPRRLVLVGQLRRAIEARELVLYFQPKAQLSSGEIMGAEALVRWRHPHRGLLLPDEFIPLAQQTGLIRPLTFHVLDEALRQASLWQLEGLDLRVAVNVAMRNLLDMQFPDDVSRLLAKWEISSDRLELEITESTIMADPFRARLVLTRLSEMGVRLSIDDFGTGYSSLGYLRRLPVREIKIDKSFVMNMRADENDAVIVRSTIDLGRNLGLEVVAEGVESAAIWQDLVTYGCDVAQGFFLSRPVPAEDLTRWILDKRARGAETQRFT